MKKTFLIHLTEEEKEMIKKAAKRENRSISNFIVTTVIEKIKK